MTSKTIYQTGIKIAHITYNDSIFQIFIDEESNGAILITPDMYDYMWFPLGMTIGEVIRSYFGRKRISTDDSDDLKISMSSAPFCVIHIE